MYIGLPGTLVTETNMDSIFRKETDCAVKGSYGKITVHSNFY